MTLVSDSRDDEARAVARGRTVGRWSVRVDRAVGRFVYPLHVRIYRLTRGRVGSWTPMGPIVLLAHTGRRSGRRYAAPLLAMRLGGGAGAYAVVASNGGRPEHPQWLRNVEANPEVEVTERGDTRRMRATVASPERRAELWPRLVSQYPGWAHYQTLTDREIPVVELEPLSDPDSASTST